MIGKTSVLRCSIVCAMDEECIVFNHNAVDGRCELIDSSGVQQEKQVANDSVWTVYVKGKDTSTSRKHVRVIYTP